MTRNQVTEILSLQSFPEDVANSILAYKLEQVAKTSKGGKRHNRPVVAEQLRNGDRVLLEPCCSSEPRVAVIEDNETQSLVRHVEIESLNGYEADSYAIFADEITGYVNPKGL